MRQVCQRFQQDVYNDIALEHVWVELVELQNSEVRFEIVLVFFHLVVDISLERAQVVRIVPEVIFLLIGRLTS